MRIDGEQETEGAADAVDVCGWLISLNLISMIVDPPDGRVPRVYRPNFASQFSRLESEGRSDVQREYRKGTTVRCCPSWATLTSPHINLQGCCVCLSALRSACGRDHQSRMGRARQ